MFFTKTSVREKKLIYIYILAFAHTYPTMVSVGTKFLNSGAKSFGKPGFISARVDCISRLEFSTKKKKFAKMQQRSVKIFKTHTTHTHKRTYIPWY